MPDDRAAQQTPAEHFDIETVQLHDPIGGSEGLDVNHASRLRMQFLVSQHASMVSQVQFADAKAGALLTVMGLIALNGPVRIGQTGTGDFLSVIVFILMMVAVGFGLVAILPRYPDGELSKQIQRRDRFAWPGLIAYGYEPLDHANFMRRAEATQLIMSIAQTNSAMAHVLRKKFKFLRTAFILAAIDVFLIVSHVMGLRLG